MIIDAIAISILPRVQPSNPKSISENKVLIITLKVIK